MSSSKHVCESQLRLLQQIEAREHVLEKRAENTGRYLILGWVVLIALYIII